MNLGDLFLEQLLPFLFQGMLNKIEWKQSQIFKGMIDNKILTFKMQNPSVLVNSGLVSRKHITVFCPKFIFEMKEDVIQSQFSRSLFMAHG